AHHQPGSERRLARRGDLPVSVGSRRPRELVTGGRELDEELVQRVTDLAEVEAGHDDPWRPLERPGQPGGSVHLPHFTGTPAPGGRRLEWAYARGRFRTRNRPLIVWYCSSPSPARSSCSD